MPISYDQWNVPVKTSLTWISKEVKWVPEGDVTLDNELAEAGEGVR